MRTKYSSGVKSLLFLCVLFGCEKTTGLEHRSYSIRGTSEMRAGESQKATLIVQYDNPPKNRAFEATVDFASDKVVANPNVLRFELSEAGYAEAPFYVEVAKDTKPGRYVGTVKL